MGTKPTYQELEKQLNKLQQQTETLIGTSLVKDDHVYHALFSNMAEGFAHCQMFYENNEPDDFMYLEVNRAFEELTGLKNVVGKRISEILVNHKTENPELFALYHRVSQTGNPERIETYVAPLDTWFSISVYSSEKGQFLVIFDNITNRKKSETALRESEEQFRGLFTQSHVATAIVGLDKHFLKCNNAFCAFLGFSEEEILGKTIADFTHPEDLEIGMSEMVKIIKGETNHAVFQKRYIRSDNKVVWGELTISIVRDKDGKALYFLPVIQDITERKKAIASLEENQAALKDLNTTKDKLISIIAHDLRNPCGNILGFSDLLMNNITAYTHDDLKKYLGYINSSTHNTLTLLDNLLDWAKNQTGKIRCTPEQVSLAGIIDEVFQIKDFAAKSKNIALEYTEAEDIVFSADKNMLTTIMRNLISNAVKYTNNGGRVLVSALAKKDRVEISVSDNGIGMNDTKVKELFKISTEANTLGTSNEKGSGIGLVLCNELIAKHKGNIQVESTEGKGSTFTLTLPAVH